MKSTTASKHARLRTTLTCSHSIFLQLEILQVGCLEQMAAVTEPRQTAAETADGRLDLSAQTTEAANVAADRAAIEALQHEHPRLQAMATTTCQGKTSPLC